MSSAQSLLAQGGKKKEAKKIGSGNLKKYMKRIKELIPKTDLKKETIQIKKIRLERVQIKDQRGKEVEKGGE